LQRKEPGGEQGKRSEKGDGIIVAAEGDHSVQENLGCNDIKVAASQTQACKWDFKALQ
jgi:hypothetical protein